MKRKIAHHARKAATHPKLHGLALLTATLTTAGREALESEAVHSVIILALGHVMIMATIALPVVLACGAFAYQYFNGEA